MLHLHKRERIELAKALLVTSLIKDSIPFKNRCIAEFLLEFFSNDSKPRCIKKKDLIKYNILSSEDKAFFKFIDIMSKNDYFIVEKVNKIDSEGKEYFYLLTRPGNKIKDLLIAIQDRQGKSIYEENLILTMYDYNSEAKPFKNKYNKGYK